MKTFLFFLFLAFTLLYSCADDSSAQMKTTGNDVANSQLINTLMADKIAAVYSYDSTYRDSTLVCRQWFLKDSLLKKWGEFRYSLPLESEFAEEYIISEAKGKPVYETFDSLICEVGGSSAWNKYVFTYDSAKRPTSVKHYKAWYEQYDEQGNVYNNSQPDYALAEHNRVTYGTGLTQQITKDETGKIMEKITSVTDHQLRPVFEERYRRDEYGISDNDRIRVYYQYNDRRQLAAF